MELVKGQKYDVQGLRCVGWTDGDGSGHEGYSHLDYFAADGTYRGADAHGIEPIVDVGILITDGTETSLMKERTVTEAIKAYAEGYGFNEPGEVEARVLDAHGETTETFTIRSEDGRRGYLVRE